MIKLNKIFLAFALVILPISFVFAGCGSSIGGGSLLANQVYVSADTLNGGKMSERINKDGNAYFRKFMNLSTKNYDKNIYHLLNNYCVDYAYEMNAVTDDVVKEGKVFGGWYLDRNCTVGNYLTKSTFAKKKAEVGEQSLPLYARWLEPGTRELIFEVDGENITFDNNSIKNIELNNNQIRYTFSQTDYDSAEKLQTIINNFPKVNLKEEYANELGYEKEFKKWKVDFNGLRYDYKYRKYLPIYSHYLDAFMTVPYHNFSYSNFFASGVDKPYALLKPETKSRIDDVVKVFFNENDKNAYWNPNYGKDEEGNKIDRIIDKYTTLGLNLNSFDNTIYDQFVNHGLSAKQREMEVGGIYKDIPFKPNTNDITKEGKVFAGWYLDSACTPEMYFCKTTFAQKVVPNIKKMGYEIDLYARWIDTNQREVIFSDENGMRRITFNSMEDTVVQENPLTDYVINYNGLLFDYSLGEYSYVPEDKIIEENYENIYLKVIEPKYYEVDMYSYENFIKNGANKPYMLLEKKTI